MEHKAIKQIDLASLDFTDEVAWLDINQDKINEMASELMPLTPEINQTYVVASLYHLGFDTIVAQDISRHQWNPTSNQAGLFAESYFHFEISIPLEAEKQTGFLAIMDSEEHFNQRQAVEGGYLYGNIGKGTLLYHIYGLHNGPYAMLAFIDSNRNKHLDFDPSGQSSEKYATFTDKTFSNLNEMSFSSISTFFNYTNSKVYVNWKG